MLKTAARTHDTRNITYAPRLEALDVVRKKIQNVQVVLDLGPGICPQPFVTQPYVHICVDAHRPYLERLKRERADDPKYVFVNAPWDAIVPALPDKSVDTVFALDFIEHLDKHDGQRMLREAERVARYQIVVYTPLGFFPQSYDDPNQPDRWGMDGAKWQTHRSGWDLDDFSDEWEFVISPDYITLDEHNQSMEQPMAAFWAIRTLGTTHEPRYRVMEDDSAGEHAKIVLEKVLPRALYNGLRSAKRRLFN